MEETKEAKELKAEAVKNKAMEERYDPIKKAIAVIKKRLEEKIEAQKQGKIIRYDGRKISFLFFKKDEINIKAEDLEMISDYFHKEITERDQDINMLNAENDELSIYLYQNSLDFFEKTKIQFFPIDIYLDTNEPELIFEAYESILSFIEYMNFEKVCELKSEKGSWKKKLVAKTKEYLTSEDFNNHLKKAEYAVEANLILKQQSEIDKNQSEALLNILKAVESIPNAAIRIGSLLVVKVTNKEGEVNVQVRTLSITELHYLNKYPDLLNKPNQILSAITEEVNNEDEIKKIE
jgi:hypothetical protein